MIGEINGQQRTEQSQGIGEVGHAVTRWTR
jgi:hypothetical protein